MAFKLAGFFRITDRIDGFAIPFFSLTDSNACLTHELNDEGRIERFVHVDPDRYRLLFNRVADISVREGDPGLIGLVVNNQLIFGTVKDMTRRVADVGSTEDLPFLELELAKFANDSRRIESAIEATKNLLEAHHQRSWETNQKATPKSASETGAVRDPIWLDGQLQALRNHPEQDGWAQEWLLAWQRHPRHERLRELAMWWLSKTHFDRDGYASVLSLMLRYRRHHPSIVDIARDWISSASLSAEGWARVWYRLRTSESGYVLVERGREYLNVNSYRLETGKEVLEWSKVWRSITQSERLDNFMIGVAVIAFQHTNAKSKIIEKVLLPIVRSEPNQEVAALLEDWLYEASYTTAWAKLYSALARIRPARSSFNELGWNAISTDRLTPRAWALVWRVLARSTPGLEITRAAEQWLGRTEPDTAPWLSVLAEALKFEPRSPYLEHVAQRWLADHEADPRGLQLARQLAEGGRLWEDSVANLPPWRSTVEDALHFIGGQGNLTEIYEAVELLRGPHTLPPSWKAIVRRTLGDGSPTSEHFLGSERFFRDGVGQWTLMKPRVEDQLVA